MSLPAGYIRVKKLLGAFPNRYRHWEQPIIHD